MGREQAKTAVIFGSAPVSDWSFLKAYAPDGATVLCADGGRNSALAAGFHPDWYVGDGDSGGSPEGLPAVVLPEEKDTTDLESAVHYALSQGYETLLICGATGGRMDHHLANCFLLEQIAEAGANALLIDGVNEISYLAPGHYTVKNDPPCRYLGLIPLDRTVTGVTLRGVKYPLTDASLRRCEALTVSNEILPNQDADITIGSGAMLMVRSERLH